MKTKNFIPLQKHKHFKMFMCEYEQNKDEVMSTQKTDQFIVSDFWGYEFKVRVKCYLSLFCLDDFMHTVI